MTLVKFLDSCDHRTEANSVGVEHGAAAPRRESVAVEVHDVDVGRAQRDALTEQMSALVHQREDTAIHNFVAADGAPLDARLASGLLDQSGGFGIGRGLTVFVILRPSTSGLLAEAPHLAQPVRDLRHAYAGFF